MKMCIALLKNTSYIVFVKIGTPGNKMAVGNIVVAVGHKLHYKWHIVKRF